MGKILVPTNSPDQWQSLLAEPEKHWKRGYSARALAYCWQEADGFPESVRTVLAASPQFSDIEMLLAIPEHQVSLPGGSRPSQNDLWILARCNDGLISIAVEGKVNESFGPTIKEWDYHSSPGRTKRLEFICFLLDIDFPPAVDIRYQLFHRTASSILEAKRFQAKYAVMLVHSFSLTDQWFEDYARFLSFLGTQGAVNSLSIGGIRSQVDLSFAWVQGEERYLKV